MKLKKVAKFLAPAQMLIGKFPDQSFLNQFELQEYQGISEACQAGDLKKFEEYQEEHMSILIQSGVFLAVEKLRYITLRNLIKNIEV